ncbi:MAG: hypothetical protein H0T79_17960 [Deltaproteobacteria bacterium]|nr:hypothetical protein [Deltaproteobacteria bacterium]
MKIIRTFAMLTVLATGSVASADKAPAPTPTTPDKAAEVSADDVKKWLVFFDQVVVTVVSDKDNCDKMATDLGTLFDTNAALIATAHEHKAAGRKLPKDAQDKMLAGVKKMAPAMQKCMSNEKVKKVFERFDGKTAKGKR